MKPAELTAISAFTAIQATLDRLPSQRMRRCVVKMVAEYESARECQERIVEFTESPSQTVAR